MTKVKKRVRKPITKEQSKITMDTYRGKIKDDNWIRPYCTIPAEYHERFNNMTEDMCTQGRWDRRAKAECKAIGGMPTNVWYHARDYNGDDMFVDSSFPGANNGWGLFPSHDAIATAWAGLTDEQREAVADETSNLR